jgi:hypothetical protein
MDPQSLVPSLDLDDLGYRLQSGLIGVVAGLVGCVVAFIVGLCIPLVDTDLSGSRHGDSMVCGPATAPEFQPTQ